MKLKMLLLTFFALGLLSQPGYSRADGEAPAMTVDEILTRVEKRYSSESFSATFDQASTLKAIGITDHASGRALFRHPAKMRWEYASPERQEIITDGLTLWIHRPEENQVMLGRSPAYFGDGKGASFLSDIGLIRKRFTVSLAPKAGDPPLRLKLIPQTSGLDLSEIFLSISGKTFDIIEILTYNAYGDETRITLSNFNFGEDLDDSRFTFRIPENTDILYLEEGN